jgi:uncharacterized membrane protein
MFSLEFVRQMAGAASKTQTDISEHSRQSKIKAAIALLRENNYIVSDPDSLSDKSEL